MYTLTVVVCRRSWVV